MADFGTNFANSFNAVTQMMQGRAALKQRAEEMKLRSKLLDMHVEEFQRKLQSGETLKSLLTRESVDPTAGFTGSSEEFGAGYSTGTQQGSMTPQATVPNPPTMRELALALTPVDPGAAVKLLIDQENADREHTRYNRGMTFVERFMPQAAAPAPAQAPTAMPATPAPTPAPMPSPHAPQGPPEPTPAFQPPTQAPIEFQGFTMDPSTGKLNLKFGQNDLEVKDSEVEAVPGSGVKMRRRDFIDKRTGRTVGTQMLGRVPSGEAAQRVESIVRTWGIDPTTPLGQGAIGEIFQAEGVQGDVERNIAMQRVQKKYAGLAAQAPPAAPTGQAEGGSVIEAGRAERAKRVAAETQAREQTQLEENPPPATTQQKLTFLKSAERQATLVRDLLQPEFVGKGFKKFGDELKAQMAKQEAANPPGAGTYKPQTVHGAMAGALRTFAGTATPQETEFRAAILDLSDMLLRARSGAQINEAEYARLAGTLPNLYDEAAIFLPRLRRFRDEVGNQIDDVYSLSGKSMKQQRGERATEKQQMQQKEQSRTQPKGGTTAPVTPDAIYDPKTNRLMPVPR